MRKAKEFGPLKRFVIPSLAVVGSLFMIYAAIFAHGIKPYLIAKEEGFFAMPLLFYLIVFAVVFCIGLSVNKDKKTEAGKN